MSDIERPSAPPPPPGYIVAFAPERHERVKQIVKSRHAVRVEDLKDELGVSTATIRRDLHELEEEGELRRVHGGAISIDIRPTEVKVRVAGYRLVPGPDGVPAGALGGATPVDAGTRAQ